MRVALTMRMALEGGPVRSRRNPCRGGKSIPPRLPRAMTMLAAVPAFCRKVVVMMAKAVGKIGPKQRPMMRIAMMVSVRSPMAVA